jgi:hypothetical protein
VLAVVAGGDAAHAQRGAASKINGSAYEYPYYYQSAGAYGRSAYEHADVLREATSYGEPVPQAVASEHTAAIRQNLETAGRKYASLRKMAGDNKEVHKHLDAIAEHHQAVLGYCEKIDTHCAGGKGEAATVNAHAHDAAESLKAAQLEHEKLMQHFSRPVTKPAPAK